MPDDPADLALMASIGAELLAAVDGALGPWVRASVRRFRDDLDAEAVVTAAECRAAISEELRVLLAIDVDEQVTTPLAVLRGAARYPTAVLRSAGVEQVARDAFDERRDPSDVYGLAPATWADLGPEVAEAGLRWGAAKAHLHLQRRR